MPPNRNEQSYLIFDIETVIDPGLPISAKTEQTVQTLPPAPHHQVVAIGVLWMDASYRIVRLGIVGEGKAEPQVLADFVKFIDERRPDLVTYNGRGFDLPVIVARCLRHAIPFRHYFQASDVRYRYSPAGHLDLMDYLSDFGACRATSLDTMAKLIGLPGKVGIDGKDVGPMVFAGRIAEVNAYCLCDVAQTTGLFLRVQLVRGLIDLETYRAAMRGLILKMNEDPRLHPVANGIDAERLLVGATTDLPSASGPEVASTHEGS